MAHTKAFLLMSCALITLIAALPSSTRAQTARHISVECEAFQRNANGSWTLNRETTVNEGIYGLVLKPGTFRTAEKDVFGYDLIGLLEKDCTKPTKR